MNFKRVITFLVIIVSFGCAKRQIARYYILDYNPIVKAENRLPKLFPYKIQVKEFNIDRTYDNSRIVIRQSAHEVYYDRMSLWATRPQSAITNLLIKHINKLELFERCESSFLDEKPDYIISGTIHSIEKYKNARYNRADLQISLYMLNVSNDRVILNYEINKFIPLYTDNMDFFAKELSDALDGEFTAFLSEVIDYFSKPQTMRSKQ